MTVNDRNLPNLARDLVLIHKVISRGLNVGLTRGKEFLADGFPNTEIQRGFTDYTRSFGSVLGAHHLGEDEVAFPALKKWLPKAPYTRLAADHKKIEAALAPMIKSFSEISGQNPLEGLGVVIDSLKKITAIWASHIGVEETSFGPKIIAEVMTPEEQAAVSISLAKISQAHAGPPALVVPFVLFNLSGADRAAMSAGVPAPVMEMVEKEWKDQWTPMKPFLLD